MSQPISQQLDPKTIETLKAASNQVTQAPLEASTKSEADITGVLPLKGFAEEFVQKVAFIERETVAVDEEMAKAEKLWSSLVEKKKQLEARKNELIKVKDKLKELDKEMSDVLESQSFDKLRIDPEQRRTGQ